MLWSAGLFVISIYFLIGVYGGLLVVYDFCGDYCLVNSVAFVGSFGF